MKIFTSWRTSLSGILTGVGMLCAQLSFGLDSDPKTLVDLNVIITAIGLIGIGMSARDNAVSSKTAGIK